MKSLSYLLATTIVLSLAAAHPAAADPIVITSGSMLVTGQFESGSISLTGTRGFSLRALVDPSEGAVDAMNLCNQEEPRCAGGSTISIGTNLVGSAFPRGVATVDGLTFENIDDANSPATVLLRLNGTITLPAMTGSPVVVTAPFAVGESAFFLPFPLQQVAIQGAGGTATLSLIPGRDGEGTAPPWVLDQISYAFSSDGGGAPIPEPGTMLLVAAAGVAGAWRSRRQRTAH
jgi:hypothetical protein